MATVNQAVFPGFQFPNTTQIPNEVFDTLMSKLSGGELKVLLYICRRTFGFRKDSDSISLTQIAHGITTKAGRVLDQGTGLSKRQVQRALRALEGRQVIQIERKVDGTGLHEINTYRLNVKGGDILSPPVETPVSGRVGTPMSLEVETPESTTKQREQKKEEQKKDTDVDVVAKDLKKFGMTPAAVTTLLKDYPASYIKGKLEMAKGLVTAGSALVSQNPAGWLRRAIEEDYTLPKPSERHRQHSGREKKGAKQAQAEFRATSDVVGEQHMAKEQPQPAQNVATEKKEPQKISRENELVWNKALENLQANLPGEEVAARLTGTALLEVSDTAALIFVPNRTAVAWLERRLYGQIAKALKAVIGKDVDLQFISEMGFSPAGSFGV
jgi:phage replication O-like protein O